MGLTHDEIVIACKNIGFDIECGACAGLFYTGTSLGEHDPGCRTVQHMFNAFELLQRLLQGAEITAHVRSRGCGDIHVTHVQLENTSLRKQK